MTTPTGRARRAALAMVTLAAFLLAPPAIRTARAEQAADAVDRARQHFVRGKELFAAADYRGAMAEFAAADKLAPSPLLEFNIALCHERLGERVEAVRRYRLYLERVPDAANRAAVEAKVSRLESEIQTEAEAKRPAPTLVPPPVGPGAEAAPPVEESAPQAEPPASTGDPELDRVSKIDIRAMRAKRQGAAETPRAAAAPRPRSEGPAPPPARDAGGQKDKPLYKKWWFWVAAGVGTILLISIITDDSEPRNGRGLILPPSDASRGPADAAGVLLRF